MDKEQIIKVFYDNASDLIVCKDKVLNEALFPLIVIHETGFYVFCDYDISDTSLKKKMLDDIYNLQLFFNTNRLNFNIYGITENSAYYLNPITDEVSDIGLNGLEEHIIDNLNSGSYSIDANKFFLYREKIAEHLNQGEKTKTDEEGNLYIKKGQKWFPASDEDQDVMFKYTLFGGLLGFHKFKQGKKLAGILYLLTGGLLGIGWVFDLLAMVLGVGKDAEGRYYLPLSNKKMGMIGFACSVALSFLVVKIYSLFISYFALGLATVLSGIVGSFM